MKTKERKVTVKLVESNEVLNFRIVAETIASKIRRGDIQL